MCVYTCMSVLYHMFVCGVCMCVCVRVCVYMYVCVISHQVLCVCVCDITLRTWCVILAEFLVREEASEVKAIVEKAGQPAEDKLKEVYARFQGLVCAYTHKRPPSFTCNLTIFNHVPLSYIVNSQASTVSHLPLILRCCLGGLGVGVIVLHWGVHHVSCNMCEGEGV